jgi:hypothetical protein
LGSNIKCDCPSHSSQADPDLAGTTQLTAHPCIINSILTLQKLNIGVFDILAYVKKNLQTHPCLTDSLLQLSSHCHNNDFDSHYCNNYLQTFATITLAYTVTATTLKHIAALMNFDHIIATMTLENTAAAILFHWLPC